MFKRKHTTDTAVTVHEAEAPLRAADPSDHDQPLRDELARILGVNPEQLHPDNGRRADA